MLPEMQENEKYLTEFLHILFMYSMEISKGIPKEEFLKQMVKIYTYYENPRYYASIKDVSSNGRWFTSISSEFIEKFFYEGMVNPSSLLDSYMDSEYADINFVPLILFKKFTKKDIDENEISNLYDKLKLEINNQEYTSAKVILYAFDTMLKFSQIGLEEKSEEDIVSLAKKYIGDVIIVDKPWEVNEILNKNIFLTRASSPFEEIYTAILERVAKLHNERMAALIQDVGLLLPKNPDAFIESLPTAKTFGAKLTRLDPIDFSQKIISVHTPKLRYVLEKIFYNIGSIDDRSSHDATWAKEFYFSLKDRIPSLHPLKRHIISEFMIEFYKLIQEKYQLQDS